MTAPTQAQYYAAFTRKINGDSLSDTEKEYLSDPNPWLCSLCGRMSHWAHVGWLHGIALFDVQSTLEFKPRSYEEVQANIEERSSVVMAAQARRTP